MSIRPSVQTADPEYKKRDIGRRSKRDPDRVEYGPEPMTGVRMEQKRVERKSRVEGRVGNM